MVLEEHNEYNIQCKVDFCVLFEKCFFNSYSVLGCILALEMQELFHRKTVSLKCFLFVFIDSLTINGITGLFMLES